MKKIIAYVMHRHEREQAAQMLDNAQVTDAFVIGDADDAAIAHLSSLHIIAQPIESVGGWPDAAPETPGAGTRPFAPFAIGEATGDVPDVLDQARSRGIPFDSILAAQAAQPNASVRASIPQVGAAVPLPAAPPDPQEPVTYLIQIVGPMLADFEQRLQSAGGMLISAYGNGYYTVCARDADLAEIESLPFVTAVRRYNAADAVAMVGGSLPGQDAAALTQTTAAIVDLRLHRPEDAGPLKAWLIANNVPIVGESSRKIRVSLPKGDLHIALLGATGLAESIEEYIPPQLANDRARGVVGLGSAAAAPVLVQTGNGQIVAVADTGVDGTHPDLCGRVLASVGFGRPGVTDDPEGHGTHVCGSIAGTGTASNGAICGIAPKSQLYVQSLWAQGDSLHGLPIDLADLFDPAYQAGARIHSNSWGSPTQSRYTSSAFELDEYVCLHKDLLVVVAAGNDADASQAQTPGVVDWLSIDSPATAKNALTVGACRTDRTDGPNAARSWNQVYGARFPVPAVSTGLVTGDPDSMAAFSSRGPANDRRIKPDLVAPGTDVASLRSDQVTNPGVFLGFHPIAPQHYAYLAGTSMATPLVSGCAALVREYFITEHAHLPSAALVRATLVNGTHWMTGADANASNAPGVLQMDANYDQGFGRIDLAASLPSASRPALVLAFSDDWQDPAKALGATGAQRRFDLIVTGGAELRICLVYNDAPGRGLQNNLNLFVQLPDFSKRVGNTNLRASLGPTPDADNNVEIVRVANPSAGAYLVQVTATNLLKPPQDFALVVVGELGAFTEHF